MPCTCTPRCCAPRLFGDTDLPLGRRDGESSRPCVPSTTHCGLTQLRAAAANINSCDTVRPTTTVEVSNLTSSMKFDNHTTRRQAYRLVDEYLPSFDHRAMLKSLARVILEERRVESLQLCRRQRDRSEQRKNGGHWECTDTVLTVGTKLHISVVRRHF
eukprot:SAG31_NODE_4431_length_3236_cov_2.397832_2_plen_159_part_00